MRELGAIYEGLLEFEPVVDATAPGGLAVRPNPFSRKSSGSYYTPDELVSLIVTRTVGPLVDERIESFRKAAERAPRDKRTAAEQARELADADPASAILDLKICDPAMGSGHFLVSLIDYLSARVVTAIGEAAAIAGGAQAYVSPLLPRLAEIRERIRVEAVKNRWTIREAQLTDQNLIKRMVLKRCVYGVDKNPMAVELAKVALWLHTFTAGAPLSFLDHHLRCGDSLFGERVRPALDELQQRAGMFIGDAIRRAEGGIAGMEFVENQTDAEIAEVKASRETFAEVERITAPLAHALDALQAAKWVLNDDKRDKSQDAEKGLWGGILSGVFGDAFDILSGAAEPQAPSNGSNNGHEIADRERRAREAAAFVARLRALAAQEHFLHWEVAFPGVWRNWQSDAPEGGFDAVVGNPPWDRMKMQEVEWFAARAPQIAKQARAADRKRLIEALKEKGDPLSAAYDLASARAEKAMERARKSGDYPLLSRGDINIYSLFVERAQALIKPSGIAGLLTPSGILSDQLSERFLKDAIPAGRLILGVDFFNKRDDGTLFFPDVYYRYKFCAFICAKRRYGDGIGRFAFFQRTVPGNLDDQLIEITAEKIDEISPTSFLVPVLRSERDFAVAMKIAETTGSSRFHELGVLRYRTMFHMAGDSSLFLTINELDSRKAYPTEDGRWRTASAVYERLYEGKMVQAFDHRAASIGFYRDNTFRTGASEATTEELYADPKFVSVPRFFIDASHDRWEC